MFFIAEFARSVVLMADGAPWWEGFTTEVRRLSPAYEPKARDTDWGQVATLYDQLFAVVRQHAPRQKLVVTVTAAHRFQRVANLHVDLHAALVAWTGLINGIWDGISGPEDRSTPSRRDWRPCRRAASSSADRLRLFRCRRNRRIWSRGPGLARRNPDRSDQQPQPKRSLSGSEGGGVG